MSVAPISAEQARRLLLGAQGLLDDPSRRSGPKRLYDLVLQLGLVQLDSINVVARAHDLTLWSRLDGYTPSQLDTLLWKRRKLFEGWTHDASVIPTVWYRHWKRRFRRDRERIERHVWWRERFGTEAARVLEHVRARVMKQGPVKSSDFEHDGPREPWWGWKPAKAALDFLWRVGELAIARREGFQKVYDLAERVLPGPHADDEPAPDEHRHWACSTAAERLLVFTPRELASFWDAVELAEARRWCEGAAREGRLEPVDVGSADSATPKRSWAVADWRERLSAWGTAPERIRWLSPFDPILRDRGRCLRLFGFDYRLEAFVPPAKRRHGYYVLPLLEGERLIGRADVKLHRSEGVLEVRGVWWEPGIRMTVKRRRAWGQALDRLGGFVGADSLALCAEEGTRGRRS